MSKVFTKVDQTNRQHLKQTADLQQHKLLLLCWATACPVPVSVIHLGVGGKDYRDALGLWTQAFWDSVML